MGGVFGAEEGWGSALPRPTDPVFGTWDASRNASDVPAEESSLEGWQEPGPPICTGRGNVSAGLWCFLVKFQLHPWACVVAATHRLPSVVA